MYSLNKNKGFSLIEIMITLGISAGLAVLAAKLLSDQQFNQNHLKLMGEIDKYQSILQTKIKKQDFCKATFMGVNLPTGVSTEVNIPPILPVVSSDFSVTSTRLRNPLPTSRYAPLRDKVKELLVTYELNKSFFSNETITKSTHIFMTMDAAGNFRECGSILEDTKAESLKRMCDALGAVNAEWLNPADYPTLYTGTLSQADLLAQYPNGKCQLKDVRCPLGQAPIKIDSLGGLKCHPISTRYIDLGVKVDSTPKNCSGSDTFQIVESGGLFSISCSPTSLPPSCTPINGGWSAWTEPAWGLCASGTQSRTRTRTCNSPAPNACGAPCVGPSSDFQTQACGCTPSCSPVTANDICTGHSAGGDDDGCGGTCPVIVGINPNTCASDLCLCTPAPPASCYNNCFVAGYDCVYGEGPAAIPPHGVAIKKCPDTSPTYLYCGDTPLPPPDAYACPSP
ncbi:MAG: prepilin-type N-terminal cleavage/methylation domain-containing protein [Bacteriovoracaceae bacterium]